jgi:hypothetical protein
MPQEVGDCQFGILLLSLGLVDLLLGGLSDHWTNQPSPPSSLYLGHPISFPLKDPWGHDAQPSNITGGSGNLSHPQASFYLSCIHGHSQQVAGGL